MDGLKRCSRCVTPETHETIFFDGEGVCNVCRQHDHKQEQIDWDARKLEFGKIIEQYRGQGDYDWTKLVRTLKQAGYNDALTVEFVAPLDRTPANPYPDALATTPDPELTPEQFKFIQDHGSGVLTEKFYSGLVELSAKTLRHAIEMA